MQNIINFLNPKRDPNQKTIMGKLPDAFVFSVMVIFLFQMTLILALLISDTSATSAAEEVYLANPKTTDIGSYIEKIYIYAMSIVGMLAATVIMWGGLMWVTAGGNQQRIGEAKAWIGAAMSGLILAMASYMILNTVNPALVEKKNISEGVKGQTPPFKIYEGRLTNLESSTKGKAETIVNAMIKTEQTNKCPTNDTTCNNKVAQELTENATKKLNTLSAEERQATATQSINECVDSDGDMLRGSALTNCSNEINKRNEEEMLQQLKEKLEAERAEKEQRERDLLKQEEASRGFCCFQYSCSRIYDTADCEGSLVGDCNECNY